MFIELVEYLRCPESHPEAHCVLSTREMIGRDVVSGVVGCPACQREYPVEGGVVRFGASPDLPRAPSSNEVDAVAALLGITSPGGNVVVVGSATALIRELVPRLEGVHLVGINAPPDQHDGSGVSLLEAASAIPLRSAMARGVVLGEEYANAPWNAEAARVLLPGLRLVALREQFAAVGVEKVVVGRGMWLGRKNPS